MVTIFVIGLIGSLLLLGALSTAAWLVHGVLAEIVG